MLEVILFIASFFFSVASIGIMLLLMFLVVDAITKAEAQKIRIEKLINKKLDK